MKKLLSVCMITKDEEENIERSIQSVKNIADEIIILDTGSTDKTVEIAKKMGAIVRHQAWDKDFSKARNASIENAKGQWILILDADEILPKEEGELLRKILESNRDFEAFYLRLVNIVSEINIGDAIVLRVFKNRPEYRFRGKMHEQVINAIQETSGMNVIGSTQVKILHYGYDPGRSNSKEKQQRNIELLLSYKEEEKDGYYYYSLGNEYARLDENEKALVEYYKALEKTLIGEFRPIYYPYLITNMVKVYSNKKNFAEALNIMKECFKNSPDFKDLYFLECLTYIDCGMYTKAQLSLYNFLNCQPKRYEYPSNNFEENYDIDELIIELLNASIHMPEKLISVIISTNRFTLTLYETVKSFNEIAHEVIITCPETKKAEFEILKNIAATLIFCEENKEDENFFRAVKKAKSQFIMRIYDDEICSLEMQKGLKQYLPFVEGEVFELSCFSEEQQKAVNEIRIIQNHPMQNYEEYLEFITQTKAIYLPVYVHKIKDIPSKKEDVNESNSKR